MFADDFSGLQDDIKTQTGADRVLVLPPFVWLTEGEHITRYWMPETVHGDLASGPHRLRAVPPNARLRR